MTEYENNCRTLKKVLGTFRGKDFFHLWEDHVDFCRSIPNFDVKRRHADIVQELFDVAVKTSLKTSSFEDLIGKFSLLNVALHCEKRSWKTYQLINGDYSVDTNGALEDGIKKELEKGNINCHITSCMKVECVWLRLGILEPYNLTKAYYMQYCPSLPYVFISSVIGANFKKCVFKALLNVFKASEITLLPMQGRHIDGLLKMAYQKESNQLIGSNKNLPVLLRRSHRRRPGLEQAVPEIIDRDLSFREERKKYLEKVYGKYNPPKIEKLTIMANTSFPEISEEKLSCTIIFKGSDVLTGLSKLVEEGIIKGNMPKYLEDVAISGTDTIYVYDNEDEEQ